MPNDSSQSRRSSPWQRFAVGLLFVGSGAAALIYEVAWFHLLRLVIGASAISLGILLASFMGGMCLGSLALPRVVPPRFHPLRVYAALELGIAAFGCLLPRWLPAVSDWYVRHAEQSLTGIAFRAIVAAVLLIPPTMLMGATLPAVARWVKSSPDGIAQLGFFYGANIVGAVIGCLAAGFAILPCTDVVFASHVAAALNVLVAVGALAASQRADYQAANEPGVVGSSIHDKASVAIYLVAALSGFAALGAEIVWTRLLALLLGSTVYTFAILLAVFLAGLGIGSTLAAYWLIRSRRPLPWLAAAQLAIVCLVPYSNHMITRVVPFWPRPAVAETADVYAVFAHDVRRAMVVVLPPAIFWGASFPLALASAGRAADTTRLVARIYAANTLGAIFGAILTSAVFIPYVGSQRTQQILVLVSGLAATLALAVVPQVGSQTRNIRWLMRLGPPVLALASAWLVPAPPPGMLARGLEPAQWGHEFVDIYVREGRNAPVAVQQKRFSKLRFMCIGGKVEASNIPQDLRCERLLGHLPALIHPRPRKTLTVGLGTGSTAGCFVLHPEVEQIAICEIEPLVCDAAAQFFEYENHGVVSDMRTTIHFDDARHYLAVTDERFDVITSDPINSWIRGAAALYSSEYFELCRRHLRPGGIMVQWIPLYEKDLATAKCELATFLRAFPHATLWTSWTPRESDDQRHDIIAVGHLEPAVIDLETLETRLSEYPKLKAAMEEVNLGTVPDLIGQYVGRGEDLNSWLSDAELNRDVALRLEYLAGLSLWMTQAREIYREMAAFRRYPAGVFVNDAPYKDEIQRRLGLPSGTKR